MFTKQIGNVTVHFELLIIVLVLGITYLVILGVSLWVRENSIEKSFIKEEYNKVIIKGEKLLKAYQRYYRRRKSKAILKFMEFLHIVLAISYFSTNSYDCFLNHINAVTIDCDKKNFWLSLYYICQDNFDEAQSYCDKISQSEETLISRRYLDYLKQYKQGESDLAKKKMNDIYMDLKSPVLKHIADEILS